MPLQIRHLFQFAGRRVAGHRDCASELQQLNQLLPQDPLAI
jgi:hypothetical protein